jgi:actin-related protein
MQVKEEDISAELFSNIILSGGSTLFEGMAERL